MAKDRATIAPARGTVCAACPMLCDDLVVNGLGPPEGIVVERACEFGRRAMLQEARRRLEARPAAVVDGAAASLESAVSRAAGMLSAARRVLVTGLASLPIEAQKRAADLAQRLGAAFDTGVADGSLVTGPVIARAGEVTAAWEELRERADCVVLWFVDPARSHPRFTERFVTQWAGGVPRNVIAIGPRSPAMAAGTSCRHVPSEEATAVAMARRLSWIVRTPEDAAADEPLREVAEAILRSGCVAIVTGDEDRIGLSRWAVARLVRRLAHEKPAFEVRLGAGIAAGGGNAAGAAAVSTWRYGGSAAIARAVDRGGRFEPAEADGRRVLERGEADAVVVAGGLSDSMRESLRAASASKPVTVVWLGADPEDAVAGGLPMVFLRTAGPLLETGGAMLREDGRFMPLQAFARPDAPTVGDAIAAILQELGS